MTKTELMERYRNGYANNSHLDTAVRQRILTVEESKVLKAERYNEGGIVKREEFDNLNADVQKIEKKADESDMAILGLMDTIVSMQKLSQQ